MNDDIAKGFYKLNIGLLLILAESYFGKLARENHNSLVLTRQQLNVLLCLHNGLIYASEIKDELCITSCNASRIINRLVDKAFIVRKINLKDKRKIALELSAKGIIVCELHKDKSLGGLGSLTERVSYEDIEILEGLLKKMLPDTILQPYTRQD